MANGISCTIRRWFGHAQRMEENRIPNRVLCMNLEKKMIKR
jgi:hypothetical protein